MGKALKEYLIADKRLNVASKLIQHLDTASSVARTILAKQSYFQTIKTDAYLTKSKGKNPKPENLKEEKDYQEALPSYLNDMSYEISIVNELISEMKEWNNDIKGEE